MLDALSCWFRGPDHPSLTSFPLGSKGCMHTPSHLASSSSSIKPRLIMNKLSLFHFPISPLVRGTPLPLPLLPAPAACAPAASPPPPLPPLMLPVAPYRLHRPCPCRSIPPLPLPLLPAAAFDPAAPSRPCRSLISSPPPPLLLLLPYRHCSFPSLLTAPTALAPAARSRHCRSLSFSLTGPFSFPLRTCPLSSIPALQGHMHAGIKNVGL